MYSFETAFWFSEMLVLFFQVVFCQLLVFFPPFSGKLELGFEGGEDKA